jgi:hypothetical protein
VKSQDSQVFWRRIGLSKSGPGGASTPFVPGPNHREGVADVG